MNDKIRLDILSILIKFNPKPRIELIFNSNFELLISAVLSAQSNDLQVNKVSKILFQHANTIDKMLNLGVEKVKDLIKTVGLYNKKSENIIKICKILKEKYHGNVPNNRNDLQNLPGVGRKITNIVLNVAFNVPTIAVDRHVFRVCNRTNFASGKSVIEVENKLNCLVSDKFKRNCHCLFVLHGRYICKAKKPKCRICVINHLCEFKCKT